METKALVSALGDLEAAFEKLRGPSRLDDDSAMGTWHKRLTYVALAVNHLRDELHNIIREVQKP